MPATDPEDVDDMDVPLKRQEGSGIYVEQEIISSRVWLVLESWPCENLIQHRPVRFTTMN